MTTIPRPARPVTIHLAKPEDIIAELRGDFTLMESQIEQLFDFIQRQWGLTREEVITAIAGNREEGGL